MEAIKVKPLEGEQFTYRTGDIQTVSVGGTYIIRPAAGDKPPYRLWMPLLGYNEAVFLETAEEAKAVAQNNYEKRVLSAIDLEANQSALAAKDAEIEAVHAENNRLRGLIEEAHRCFDGEPEYHSQGMGCGLEDRGITDRYDAMSHGWEQAMERVYGENISWAKDALSSALNASEATEPARAALAKEQSDA